MRRASLSTILVAGNVGLLLLAALGVASVAIVLLRQLADQQALARVTQAAIVAQQTWRAEEQRLAITAQLLAERPTLQRLLAQERHADLRTFLDQFRRTARLDGWALRHNGTLVLSSMALPTPLPPFDTTLLATPADQPPLLLARAPIAARPGDEVVVARRLDPVLLQQLSAAAGLPVRWLPVTALGGDATLAEVAARALQQNAPAAARSAAQHHYLAAVPLGSAGAPPAGVLLTTLPTTAVDASLQHLLATLLLLTLLLSALATLGSLLLARRLTLPLTALIHTATRIGHGDLHTPARVHAGGEIGALAAALEEMRQRLVQLTADLGRQRAEAQAILSGMDEGVFTVDRERRLRYLNPQAAALLGTTPEAAQGRFCGDVLNPQLADGTRPCATACPILHARFRGSARATEHLLLSTGERRSVVITSAAPVAHHQVQVLRDETAQEAVHRLRAAVLANISHEFRTPLSAQLASIELLLAQLPTLSTAQIAELVRALQRSTLRLTHLIDNLLESVRLEVGQEPLRRQPLALDAVIEEALELVQPLLAQRGQRVELDLPYPLPTLLGDAPRLTQVLVNLLANANKFAPADSIISIGGAVTAEAVELWVDDQGPGLPATDRRLLFEPFHRANRGEPTPQGIGLGLWIAQRITEQHGGTLSAEARAPGARFRLRLPRPTPEEAYEDSGRR